MEIFNFGAGSKNGVSVPDPRVVLLNGDDWTIIPTALDHQPRPPPNPKPFNPLQPSAPAPPHSVPVIPKRQTTSGKKPTISGKNPTTAGKRPKPAGKRPTTRGKRITTSGKRPTVGGKKIRATHQVPLDDNEIATASPRRSERVAGRAIDYGFSKYAGGFDERHKRR